MYLVTTIDFEEDDWGEFYTPVPKLDHLDRIVTLQKIFDRYRVRPTYLLTYPAATHKGAVALLRRFLEEGKCEIGSHLHPFNTPPFEEERTVRNTMLCNLPGDLQYRKIEALHETIRRNLGVEPVSFRSGRWGFDEGVAEAIHRLGYKIDSSVTPYTDWTACYGPDFSSISPTVYRHVIRKGDGTPRPYILEVPGTIGFFQEDFAFCSRMHRILTQSELRRLRLAGLCDRLNLINKVWLSPEMATGPEMVRLAKSMRRNAYPLLNLFFHTPSLMAGLTPFTRTEKDEREFLDRLGEFLAFTRSEGIRSITLSEAWAHFRTVAPPAHSLEEPITT